MPIHMETHVPLGDRLVELAVLSGERESGEAEREYFQTCFGEVLPVVRETFGFARTAVAKSFYVGGKLAMLENGFWPAGLEWYDGQLDFEVTRKRLDEIDLEKIDALEAAHDAWKALEGIRLKLAPAVYLWLEDYFQRLKILPLVLRSVADVYFSFRGRERGGLKLADHVYWSKYKELCGLVREHYLVLAVFDREGGQLLAGVLIRLRP